VSNAKEAAKWELKILPEEKQGGSNPGKSKVQE
jgi:hypothetical protein